MRLRSVQLVAATLLTVSIAYAGKLKTKNTVPIDWNRSAAARYLDARQQWWMDWPGAQRDHDTACVSCHTTLPYALGRSSLRTGTHEASLSPQEVRMLGYVTRRVTLWKEVKPFYSTEDRGPQKTEESRGSEAVMNATIMVHYDQPTGSLREITKEALANMWALQIKDGEEAGSWVWLNFHNAPWESDESHYWGATLAAVTLGQTPASYRRSPAIQKDVSLLREYLVRNYETQPLINRIGALWASNKMPGLLTAAQRKSLLADIQSHQLADGGWTTANLGLWKRKDGTPLDTASDGYASGLTMYVLLQSGVPITNDEMQRGRRWLIANQNADGHWNATSLNKNRASTTDPAKFMSDAATAYSTLALSAFSQQ